MPAIQQLVGFSGSHSQKQLQRRGDKQVFVDLLADDKAPSMNPDIKRLLICFAIVFASVVFCCACIKIVMVTSTWWNKRQNKKYNDTFAAFAQEDRHTSRYISGSMKKKMETLTEERRDKGDDATVLAETRRQQERWRRRNHELRTANYRPRGEERRDSRWLEGNSEATVEILKDVAELVETLEEEKKVHTTLDITEARRAWKREREAEEEGKTMRGLMRHVN